MEKTVKVNDEKLGDVLTPTPKIAFGYTRVSTTMQSEEGVSLVTQKNKITDYCQSKNYILVHTYEDAGLSGGTRDRPALIELLKIIKKGNFLIVSDLSRLSRSSRDAIMMHDELKKKGAFLVCLNPDIDLSTSIGEMIFGMLMSVYQLERAQISERVSANMKTLSSQGKLRGRPPYGYKFVSKELPFEPVEEQQKVIEIIVSLYEEKTTMRQIAALLNAQGYNKTLKKEGQIFYAETVKNILAYRGLTISSKNPNLCNRYIEGNAKIDGDENNIKNNTNENNL